MKRIFLLLVTCVGCVASVGGGTFGRPRSSPVQAPAEGHARYDDGWLTPDQVRSLVGKPIAEAKRLLLSWGQTGDIIVSDDVFTGCGIGVVCDVNHIVMDEFRAKVDPRDRIFLGTNKVTSLAAPPPE